MRLACNVVVEFVEFVEVELEKLEKPSHHVLCMENPSDTRLDDAV